MTPIYPLTGEWLLSSASAVPDAGRHSGAGLQRHAGLFRTSAVEKYYADDHLERRANLGSLHLQGLMICFPVDEEMKDADGNQLQQRQKSDGSVLLQIRPTVMPAASVIYIGCIVSPPSLMDDSDAVPCRSPEAVCSTSGDWVTTRMDGLAFLEKPPVMFWDGAASYKVFGVHDWAARIPTALAAIALCWLTTAFGTWAFRKAVGFYAGLCVATCIGLFLFTRVLIPDVVQAFTVALALWAFMRALDSEEPHPRFWAFVMAASIGVGLLVKSLIAIVFPGAAAVIYLLLTREFFLRLTRKRLHLLVAP